jgi:GWxTD domain-containing protein
MPSRGFLLVTLLLAVAFPAGLPAQESQPREERQEKRPITQGLPQRELSEKERKKREKALLKELATYYKKWLQEDVLYIILPEEGQAFLELGTEEEREQFIEQFWLRRDPTPNTIENEYKEEHYRRIAYANQWYGGSKTSWKSDRGRVYIVHGPPDDVEFYPAGSTYGRPLEEGAGRMTTYAFERWRYRYLEGVGDNIILEFVDVNGIGDYRLTMDPNEKDALLALIPGADPIAMRILGLPNRDDRFSGMEGADTLTQMARMRAIDRMRLLTAVQKPPPVKFKDLEALVETRVSFNLLPFELRVDYLRITDGTSLVPVTVAVQKKDLTFQMKDDLHQCVINIFGRITTLSGRIVQTFEDVIQLDVPPSIFESTLEQAAVYQKALPLRPGLYKLNLVLRDLHSGNTGTMEKRLTVPRYEQDQLAHSSLILADLIERVASKTVGGGQFVIGDTKIRPVVGERFSRSDRLGIYLQVYNLGIDEQTHKPEATINYAIWRGKEAVFNYTETTAELERAGQQITLEKLLPLQSLLPGEYRLDITVTDHKRRQTIRPSVSFRILP